MERNGRSPKTFAPLIAKYIKRYSGVSVESFEFEFYGNKYFYKNGECI